MTARNWKDSTEWNPNSETVAMLDMAMQFIKSVPYHTSSRWTFYRLLQRGLIADKSYITKFDYVTSRARHCFFKEWRPDTLTDSIRHAYFKGELTAGYEIQFDSIEDQEFYVQCWYEARAMHEQFEHYTGPYRVTLMPFGGDLSLAMKWQLAKKLEQIYGRYDKPIKILYYGDYDVKGFQIITSALRDIKAWCKVSFDLERVGLTLEQAKTFNLPEQPNKKGCYQWEALEESDAKQLIVDSLSKYVHPVSRELLDREKDVKATLHPFFVETLNKVLGKEIFK